MGDVDHAGAGFSTFSGGKTRQDPGDRRVADDDIIVFPIQQRLEPAIGRNVSQIIRRAVEGDLNMTICVFQLQAVFSFTVKLLC